MFVFLKRGATSSDCDAGLSARLLALPLDFLAGPYPPVNEMRKINNVLVLKATLENLIPELI